MEKKRAPNNTILWDKNGTPLSERFDDPYYSKVNGRSEARYVFIDGNKILDRITGSSCFQIAELGFGTGLNFYETLYALSMTNRMPGHLIYNSFELYPLNQAETRKALSPWPEITDIARIWLPRLPQEPGVHEIMQGRVTLRLFIGEANEMMKEMHDCVDAWYLDGFSPDKNPELWSEALLKKVAEKTVAGGSIATYTAAGWVRRRLESHGFHVERIKGFGTKRHMSVGLKG